MGDTVDLEVLRRHVAVDRHSVDVPCDRHPLGSSEVRTGDDRVAVTDHLEVGVDGDRLLDGVRERLLVTRDTRDVADRTGQVDRGRCQIEHHAPSLLTPTSVRSSTPARDTVEA